MLTSCVLYPQDGVFIYPNLMRTVSPEGGVFSCPICGRRYTNSRSLEYHKKMHAGLTTCALCGKVASKVEHLRRHLENVHKLTQEDIRSIVPTRHRSKGLPGGMVWEVGRGLGLERGMGWIGSKCVSVDRVNMWQQEMRAVWTLDISEKRFWKFPVLCPSEQASEGDRLNSFNRHSDGTWCEQSQLAAGAERVRCEQAIRLPASSLGVGQLGVHIRISILFDGKWRGVWFVRVLEMIDVTIS